MSNLANEMGKIGRDGRLPTRSGATPVSRGNHRDPGRGSAERLAPSIPVNQILVGDVVERLRELPDGCVQMVCTSPPYWGLRSYGVDGQIGLESTPEEYVEKIVNVFREVRRVLRADGIVWLNLGDSYCSAPAGNERPDHSGSKLLGTRGIQAKNRGRRKDAKNPDATIPELAPNRTNLPGLKPKDLVGIPWRVALALQADGWWLRSDIIWAKPNPMPSSVLDRPTSSHEYVFLLSKSERYFYDGFAIREPLAVPDWDNGRRVYGGVNQHGANIRNARTTGRVAGSKFGPLEGSHGAMGHDGNGMRMPEKWNNPAGRNKRTVWTIATEPFPEAHFATFPKKLVEPMVLAGTSERGACPECGAPWERVVESETENASNAAKAGTSIIGKGHPSKQVRENHDVRDGPVTSIKTLGFNPTCKCGRKDTVPCIVLDPFMGAATTALVALKAGRRFLGIELNEEYVRLAKSRISQELAQSRLL